MNAIAGDRGNEGKPKDESQLLNELKASGIEVGLPINFGARKVEFKRLVLSNQSVFDPR